MSETSWFESFFGEDYFEIYADAFPAERTTMEVEAVVELLGVEPGARILDLACGHGRHAIPLAQRGFHVTGYDLSEVFLDRAEADAKAAGVEIEWIRGDMRELPFDREFEAVINLYTAFGYFADPDDDLRTLQGIQRALEPGGQLLLETLHRDGLLARFRPKITERTGSGVASSVGAASSPPPGTVASNAALSGSTADASSSSPAARSSSLPLLSESRIPTSPSRAGLLGRIEEDLLGEAHDQLIALVLDIVVQRNQRLTALRLPLDTGLQLDPQRPTEW
jgi:SAM-dependent methyltransferase